MVSNSDVHVMAAESEAMLARRGQATISACSEAGPRVSSAVSPYKRNTWRNYADTYILMLRIMSICIY